MGCVEMRHELPLIESPSSNRHGCTSLISVPRAVAEPSHFTCSRSPGPKIKRTPTAASAGIPRRSTATIHFIWRLLRELDGSLFVVDKHRAGPSQHFVFLLYPHVVIM